MIITIGSIGSGKTTLANLFFRKEKVDEKKGNFPNGKFNNFSFWGDSTFSFSKRKRAIEG